MAKQYFYAVRKGRNPGIYTSWAECEEQVKSCSGAIFKRFSTLNEAEDFMNIKSSAKNSTEFWSGLKGTPTRTAKVSSTSIDGGSSRSSSTQIPKKIMDDESTMVAYTDGSFQQSLGRYSYGVVVLFRGSEQYLSGTGNNPEMAAIWNVAGEIAGAERAVEVAMEAGADTLVICHDYEGIAKWVTGEWKAGTPQTQKYRDWMRAAKEQGLRIEFKHVRGHSGNHYNELADALARKAMLEEGMSYGRT